jgi:hypothetical protein
VLQHFVKLELTGSRKCCEITTFIQHADQRNTRLAESAANAIKLLPIFYDLATVRKPMMTSARSLAKKLRKVGEIILLVCIGELSEIRMKIRHSTWDAIRGSRTVLTVMTLAPRTTIVLPNDGFE